MAIDEASRRTLDRIGWGFVVLGIALRVSRVALDFPLWWDEAFVGVNLLRRGYFDLLKPLDYGQVCPLLFLWAERAIVGVLGFSEWTLRLFPLICAIASVVIFQRVARKALTPTATVLATAIFAVSFHPIRHAADAKPYASDLFAALVLTALAVEWWSSRRSAWLWGLAVLAPLMVALSHPAIFIAAGLGLGLAVSVWKTRRWGDRLALASFQAAAAGTFCALFVLFTSAQARATMPAMSADWAASFPPLRDPIALPFWLLDTHAGNMLAYPCGGPNGASTATLILLVVGSIALIRRGNGTIAACCLAPFGVALVAAALGRYPYGGSACGGSTRFMQYLAPAICLLAGAGASAILDRVRSPRRLRILVFGLIALAFVGVVPVVLDLSHPYRSIHAERSRAFARRFWPEVSRNAEVACLSWDLGVGEWNSIHLGLPVALCNQAITSPNRRLGVGPDWDAISADHPLRCVLSDAPSEDRIELKSWLEAMKTRFELRKRETIVVDVGIPGSKTRPERYEVFEFVPRRFLHCSDVALNPSSFNSFPAPRGNAPRTLRVLCEVRALIAAPGDVDGRRRRASKTAFPRGAWEQVRAQSSELSPLDRAFAADWYERRGSHLSRRPEIAPNPHPLRRHPMPFASPRVCLAAMAVACLMASSASAQTAKKKADTTASFRVLTGTITEVASGMATVEIGKAEAASKKAGQEWKLAFGKPTLVLRAGKNGQYSTIEVDEIKKSDVIQAVVEVKANPEDRSHAALWLVVYPSGTSPPSR